MTRLVLALLLAFTVTEAVAQAARGYDTSGRLVSTTNNGASYTPDGRLLRLHTKRGNVSKTYDTNGRLLNIGIKRGNVQSVYDTSGRLIGRGFYNTGRFYDAHGRYIATVR
jgi:YD repeat-containing protein